MRLDVYDIMLSHVIPLSCHMTGIGRSGEPVFLRDVWPSREELQEVERQHVLPAMFREVYATITHGNANWNALEAADSLLYPWDAVSTYIKPPPFFQGMVRSPLFLFSFRKRTPSSLQSFYSSLEGAMELIFAAFCSS